MLYWRCSTIHPIQAQFCNPCRTGAVLQSILYRLNSAIHAVLALFYNTSYAGSILQSMLYWRCSTIHPMQVLAIHAVLALFYNHPIQTQSAIHAVLAMFYNPSYAVSILQSMLYWRCSSIQTFPCRFNSAIHVVLALFYNPSYIGLILHSIYSVQVHIFFMYNTFYAYLILLPDSTKDAANEQW
jgi:hypothetical protein